tara:strand:- start:2367 stop:2876 length:510 start_codon:yes stop_codon:yes gene_type:complete
MSYTNPKNIFSSLNKKSSTGPKKIAKPAAPKAANAVKTIDTFKQKTQKEIKDNGTLAPMSKTLANKPSIMDVIVDGAEKTQQRELEKFKAFKSMDPKKMAEEYKSGLKMTSQASQVEPNPEMVIPPIAPIAPVAPIVDPLVQATNTNFSPRTQLAANNIFGTTSDRGLV